MAVLATMALVSVPVDHARATANEVFTLLNQYRVANGRPALIRMPAMDTIAQTWSNKMGSSMKLSHSPDYYKRYPAGWRDAAENVGRGPSAAVVHNALVKSEGHRVNMLDRGFNAVGIGFTRTSDGSVWITQNFARYDNIAQYAVPTTGDRKFVRSAYLDMLGREPDRGGWDGWARATMLSGRTAVAKGFGESREYRRRTITFAYQDVLGRTPNSAEVTSWENSIKAGNTNLDKIPRNFYVSREFYNRAGGTDSAFVQRMFQVAIGRNATQSEVTYWTGQIRTRGRVAAVAGIYGTKESALIRVDRAYKRWLGRGAAAKEREAWSAILLRIGEDGMRVELMVSNEYYNRSQKR